MSAPALAPQVAPQRAPGLPVLLLCPPGSRVYQRDNYCSHEAKASYYWYPYDLVVQSGILETLGPVEVLDATAERLTPEQALARLRGRPWRAVLSLVGAVCWSEDVEFLRRVEAETGAPLFLSGDVACAHPRQVLEALPFASGVLMDYTSDGLATHLAGGASTEVYLRQAPVKRPRKDGPGPSFGFPVPRWDLFPRERYRLPFLRQRPFASVAASFGCPSKCGFCTAAPLAFRARELDNLFEELRYLWRAGYREIHFKDLSFAADPPYYAALLERLIEEKLAFSFSCLARSDELLPERVRLMRKAGCHLVHIGVESASDRTLEKVNKGLRIDHVRAAVQTCRREGIEVLASYVLGLPWERRRDVEKTIDLAIELDTDYASFNVYTLRGGWPPADREWPPDAPARDYDLAAMRHQAYRRFYFRPSYVWGRLRSDFTPTRLRLAAANGLELLRRHASW